jgi:hypothetical protein
MSKTWPLTILYVQGDMPGPALTDAVESAFRRRFVNVEGIRYSANIWTNALPVAVIL